MSASARKRHTRKTRRLHNARQRSGKKIVRHRSQKGRTGTAHSKLTQPRHVPGFIHCYGQAEMESARLHCCQDRLTVDMIEWT